MSFESAISIRAAIREIAESRWVILAFQRQLVWPTGLLARGGTRDAWSSRGLT